MAKHPLTLSIVGHVHTYRHDPDDQELLVGTGGAPLSTAFGYGYVIVGRQPDGSLQVKKAYDYATNAVIGSTGNAADGTPR